MPTTSYRGRFAPSPTGPLHLGSIVAAVASYADARHASGTWLLRIDDVDQTRTRAGAERDILRDLNRLGMCWDEAPSRQSNREQRYSAILEHLVDASLAYRCSCSRKTIASLGAPGKEGPIYPGTCRKNPPEKHLAAAWRIALDDQTVGFVDRIQGHLEQHLAAEVGDFIVRRIDGFTAYQLAVVVDDHDQAITDVVRGQDLLWSTPRQIWLQRVLGFAVPRYAHVPLVYADHGRKLSKRDAAHPVDTNEPVTVLARAWHHLGQVEVPGSLCTSTQFWEWAIPLWNINRVPRTVLNDD